MILSGENKGLQHATDGNRATLDELFRRAGVRDPNAVALIDPPDRESFTSGPPRRLTFAQADRAISAVAAKLCHLGLQADTVVAVQLPNTAENIVTLLALLRAGMIAVPIPLLWRRHEMSAALGQIGAKAIVTSARVGAVGHADIAMQVAAELFPIRFVCGFGTGLPDSVLPFDDIFEAKQTAIVPRSMRAGHPADHVAAVTFDVTPGGLIAVARSHAELIAGGEAVSAEIGLQPHAPILSAIPPSSFAGLAVTMMPWLASGGTLSLHHGFAPTAFAAQAREQSAGAIVLPGPALGAIAEADCIGDGISTIIGLWRSPEQLASASATGALARHSARLVDVASYGEVGVIASRRGADGKPAEIIHGPVDGPGTSGATLEAARSKAGTLALRGGMVPVFAFPPGAELGADPYLQTDEAGFVDTGFTCRLDTVVQSLTVTGPPGGITTIGGYRFRPAEVETLVAGVDPAATVVALPSGMLAQQLAGSAMDNAAVSAQLHKIGVNPLIAGAFRARGTANAA